MIEAKSIYAHFSSKTLETNISNVMMDDIRLDADFYEVNQSIQINDRILFRPLSILGTVFFPGIFKRFLVDNPKYGMGFLTTSEMMMLEPDSEKYISIQFTPNINVYKVKENTLLVSRSGSIGNTIYVDKVLREFAITEDALRVIPYENKNIGLLYFYFISEYGKSVISGKKSGSVIDHIYEDDLLKLPIPILDSQLIDYFFDTYLKVKRNREDANSLISKARKLVLQYNKLPNLDKTKFNTLDPKEDVEIQFVNTSNFTSDYRLDAHFYSDLFQKVKSNILTYSTDSCQLKDVCENVFMCNRFTRNFVDEINGIRLIGTRDSLQVRQNEPKYIAKDNIPEDVIVKQNWILLARVGSLGGTFGKVAFVRKNFEDFAGSDNIIRIVPNINSIDEAYLYAFLSSDYGYYGIIQIRHGALQDALDPYDISNILIPIPDKIKQKEIGDLIRLAYDLRAEALKYEDEAQELLTKALTGN